MEFCVCLMPPYLALPYGMLHVPHARLFAMAIIDQKPWRKKKEKPFLF